MVLPPLELIRPWRRATLVAGSLAAVEFVALVVLGVLVFAGRTDHVATHPKRAVASTKRVPSAARVRLRPRPTALTPRDALKILVLNGNGRTGAAAQAAASLRHMGYQIAATANAARENYAASLVMYRPGYRPEGLRLAHDLGAAIVGPLDGMTPQALDGGQLAVILGN